MAELLLIGLDSTSGQEKIKTPADTVTGLGYRHTQALASTTWTITHNLNKYPNITVLDVAGNKVNADVSYTSLNQTVVTVNPALAGIAELI